jgi:hypothetical protein
MAAALKFLALSAIAATILTPTELLAQTPSEGFTDHGVAAPFSTHRGVAAVRTSQGEKLVLVWLYDHRGGYALLVINAETGHSQEVPTPFPWKGDGPYASILSSQGKFYSHFGSHFVEFDPASKAFTFVQQTAPQMAMSMTEDDQGLIWSVTYPQCGLVSFDPRTRSLEDYGHLNQERWAQYPRFIACDDSGWVYFALGFTRSHILAFDPANKHCKPMTAEAERKPGMAEVFRATDGRVYGRASQEEDASWYRFYQGQAESLGKLPKEVRPQSFIAGSQGLFHREFPDGTRIRDLDLTSRILSIEDPKTGVVKTVSFHYSSEGAHIMGVGTAPNGTLCGGTAFPFFFFSFDPQTGQWIRKPCYGQWNTVAAQGDQFFVGGYGRGFLLEWDPSKQWRPTVEGDLTSNPRLLAAAYPHINRPHDLLAYPDGNTLILAGTPAYGRTGGGLLIWDRKTKEAVVLPHTELLLNHSTMSLAPLPEGKVAGGTTVAPGTGGEQKVDQAELFILDLKNKKIVWHAAIFPGVKEYSDLYYDSRTGRLLGIADRVRFFVFDPQERVVLRDRILGPELGPTVSHQGPRAFVSTADGSLYLLLTRGIATVDLEMMDVGLLARSPVPITAGGDYANGRLFFASGSHLWSFQLSPKSR